MPSTPVRYGLVAAVALLALGLQGCGKNPALQAREKAEAGLEEFLDSWVRGEPPDKFADPSQPVSGTDPDRKAGFRLLSFLVVDTKQSDDKPQQLRCKVALSLQDRQRKKKVDKQVVYDVQVADTITIARAP